MSRTDPELLGLLRDPLHGTALRRDGEVLTTPDGRAYPLLDGVPVLIEASRSLFDPADYDAGRHTLARRATRFLRRRMPAISSNLGTVERYRGLAALLDGTPLVLVVGGATRGVGMAALEQALAGARFVGADVALGSHTDVICDAHDLPFADGSFDAVICQAVLEHVADPPRVVAEIHRVLRPAGILYSEVPFMQQVHEGAYDFTRYTLNGHRLLLRAFDELDSGPLAGPASALAWSLRQLAFSLGGGSPPRRLALGAVTQVGFAWLRLLDRWLAFTPGGIDGACATYVLGRRREQPREPSEVVAGYRGAGPGMQLTRG